jgi:hypothetical protein
VAATAIRSMRRLVERSEEGRCHYADRRGAGAFGVSRRSARPHNGSFKQLGIAS